MIDGINIVTNPLLPEKQPRMKLSRAVPVSDEFRREFDAWLAEFFGYERVAYVMHGLPQQFSWLEQMLLMNPKNAAIIKERLCADWP